ncbi:MAG: pseudaminic acid synthase [Candidatus Omnitrophica bacterium]|nr:pseudaminic acid synthase [Candidatus Omnitrophota bacterium]
MAKLRDFKFKDLKRCFIIAEVSANHGQDFKTAVRMIHEAKRCGADAVKFQTYTPDTITLNSNKPCFQISHSKWRGQTLYGLYQKAYTPWEWFKDLKKEADKAGIIFFSAAFDPTAVDLLEDLDVPIHKVASFELNDLPLIAYMAKTRKPVIMSTGMATVSEIEEAVTTAKRAGASEVVLLRCVSSYPAQPKDMNLRTILDLKKRFKCTVGLSDHSMGATAAIAAVSLGAQVVEKHFILDKKTETPDSFFSINPKDLADLVEQVRITEEMMGGASYELSVEEKKNRMFRRSLFAVKDIAKGEELTPENVRSIRPANGLSPKYLTGILGRKAKISISYGTPLKQSFIAGS